MLFGRELFIPQMTQGNASSAIDPISGMEFEAHKPVEFDEHGVR
jgi:hypothetical protein